MLGYHHDFGKKNEELNLDPTQWEEETDIIDDEFGFDVGATGLSHKINLSEKTLLKTSFAVSANNAYSCSFSFISISFT